MVPVDPVDILAWAQNLPEPVRRYAAALAGRQSSDRDDPVCHVSLNLMRIGRDSAPGTLVRATRACSHRLSESTTTDIP
jgi:hypothetical protein